MGDPRDPPPLSGGELVSQHQSPTEALSPLAQAPSSGPVDGSCLVDEIGLDRAQSVDKSGLVGQVDLVEKNNSVEANCDVDMNKNSSVSSSACASDSGSGSGSGSGESTSASEGSLEQQRTPDVSSAEHQTSGPSSAEAQGYLGDRRGEDECSSDFVSPLNLDSKICSGKKLASKSGGSSEIDGDRKTSCETDEPNSASPPASSSELFKCATKQENVSSNSEISLMSSKPSEDFPSGEMNFLSGKGQQVSPGKEPEFKMNEFSQMNCDEFRYVPEEFPKVSTCSKFPYHEEKYFQNYDCKETSSTSETSAPNTTSQRITLESRGDEEKQSSAGCEGLHGLTSPTAEEDRLAVETETSCAATDDQSQISAEFDEPGCKRQRADPGLGCPEAHPVNPSPREKLSSDGDGSGDAGVGEVTSVVRSPSPSSKECRAGELGAACKKDDWKENLCVKADKQDVLCVEDSKREMSFEKNEEQASSFGKDIQEDTSHGKDMEQDSKRSLQDARQDLDFVMNEKKDIAAPVDCKEETGSLRETMQETSFLKDFKPDTGYLKELKHDTGFVKDIKQDASTLKESKEDSDFSKDVKESATASKDHLQETASPKSYSPYPQVSKACRDFSSNSTSTERPTPPGGEATACLRPSDVEALASSRPPEREAPSAPRPSDGEAPVLPRGEKWVTSHGPSSDSPPGEGDKWPLSQACPEVGGQSSPPDGDKWAHQTNLSPLDSKSGSSGTSPKTSADLYLGSARDPSSGGGSSNDPIVPLAGYCPKDSCANPMTPYPTPPYPTPPYNTMGGGGMGGPYPNVYTNSCGYSGAASYPTPSTPSSGYTNPNTPCSSYVNPNTPTSGTDSTPNSSYHNPTTPGSSHQNPGYDAGFGPSHPNPAGGETPYGPGHLNPVGGETPYGPSHPNPTGGETPYGPSHSNPTGGDTPYGPSLGGPGVDPPPGYGRSPSRSNLTSDVDGFNPGLKFSSVEPSVATSSPSVELSTLGTPSYTPSGGGADPPCGMSSQYRYYPGGSASYVPKDTPSGPQGPYPLYGGAGYPGGGGFGMDGGSSGGYSSSSAGTSGSASSGTSSYQNHGPSGYQNPGSNGYQNPGSNGYQNPGSNGYQNPGSNGYQNPGSNGYQNPGSNGYQNPGSNGYQNPGSNGYQNPGSNGYQNPGSNSYISPTTPGSASNPPPSSSHSNPTTPASYSNPTTPISGGYGLSTPSSFGNPKTPTVPNPGRGWDGYGGDVEGKGPPDPKGGLCADFEKCGKVEKEELGFEGPQQGFKTGPDGGDTFSPGPPTAKSPASAPFAKTPPVAPPQGEGPYPEFDSLSKKDVAALREMIESGNFFMGGDWCNADLSKLGNLSATEKFFVDQMAQLSLANEKFNSRGGGSAQALEALTHMTNSQAHDLLLQPFTSPMFPLNMPPSGGPPYMHDRYTGHMMTNILDQHAMKGGYDMGGSYMRAGAPMMTPPTAPGGYEPWMPKMNLGEAGTSSANFPPPHKGGGSSSRSTTPASSSYSSSPLPGYGKMQSLGGGPPEPSYPNHVPHRGQTPTLPGKSESLSHPDPGGSSMGPHRGPDPMYADPYYPPGGGGSPKVDSYRSLSKADSIYAFITPDTYYNQPMVHLPEGTSINVDHRRLDCPCILCGNHQLNVRAHGVHNVRNHVSCVGRGRAGWYTRNNKYKLNMKVSPNLSLPSAPSSTRSSIAESISSTISSVISNAVATRGPPDPPAYPEGYTAPPGGPGTKYHGEQYSEVSNPAFRPNESLPGNRLQRWGSPNPPTGGSYDAPVRNRPIRSPFMDQGPSFEEGGLLTRDGGGASTHATDVPSRRGPLPAGGEAGEQYLEPKHSLQTPGGVENSRSPFPDLRRIPQNFPPPQNPLPTPHTSIPAPHNPLPTPHNPLPTPRNPLSTPQTPLPTPQTPVVTPQNPLPTPHNSIPTPLNPVRAPQNLPTPIKPVLTPQNPVLTPQNSISTPHNSIPTHHNPVLAPHNTLAPPSTLDAKIKEEPDNNIKLSSSLPCSTGSRAPDPSLPPVDTGQTHGPPEGPPPAKVPKREPLPSTEGWNDTVPKKEPLPSTEGWRDLVPKKEPPPSTEGWRDARVPPCGGKPYELGKLPTASPEEEGPPDPPKPTVDQLYSFNVESPVPSPLHPRQKKRKTKDAYPVYQSEITSDSASSGIKLKLKLTVPRSPSYSYTALSSSSRSSFKSSSDAALSSSSESSFKSSLERSSSPSPERRRKLSSEGPRRKRRRPQEVPSPPDSPGPTGVPREVVPKKKRAKGGACPSEALVYRNPGFGPALPEIRGEAQSPWAYQLAPHLLLKVFRLALGDGNCVPTLLRLSRVCRLWRDVSLEPTLWRRADLSVARVRPKFRTERKLYWLLTSRLGRARHLNLGGWQEAVTPFIMRTLGTECLELESLQLPHCNKLHGDNLASMLARCSKLEQLDLTGIMGCHKPTPRGAVGQLTLQELFERHGPRLTHLNLGHNTLTGLPAVLASLATHCPRLEVLDLSRVETVGRDPLAIPLEALQAGCPCLRVLRLSLTKAKLGAASMAQQAAAPGFPRLEHAYLATDERQHPGVTDAELERILKCSTRLTLLDVRGCQNVSDGSLVRIPPWSMEHLYLSGGCSLKRYTDRLELVVRKWAPSLVELDLAWTGGADVLDMALAAVAEEAGNLRVLNLCGSSVTVGAVARVLGGCPLLTQVNLTSCRGLPRGIKRLYENEEVFTLRRQLQLLQEAT